MQRPGAMAFVAVLILSVSLPSMAASPPATPKSAPVPDPAQDPLPAAPATVLASSSEWQAPAAETTAAPSENATESYNVVKALSEALKHELRQSSHPGVVGLVALAFGLFLVWDGSPLFRIASTFAIFMLAALLAKGAVKDYWETHHFTDGTQQNDYVADFVGMEVGIVAAMAAHKGYKGVLVIMGAAIGFACASKIDGFLVDHLAWKFMENAVVVTVWYTLWTVPLSVMFHNEKHLGLLAIVAPICGGALVSSAAFFGFTELFIKYGCKDDFCPGGHTPNGGKWVDFFLMLMNTHPTGKQDVGVFYKADDENDKTFCLDRIVVLVLWFVLAVGGMYSQLEMHKKRQGVSNGVAKAKTSAREVNTREPLMEGLLEDSA